MCFPCSSLQYYQSFMRNQEGKIELQKKFIEEFVWGKSLFWLHALLPMSFFVNFFAYSFVSSTPILRMKNKFLLHKMVAELVPSASPVSMALNSNMHKMCSPVYLSNCQLFRRYNQLFRRDKTFYQQVAKMIHWKWMEVFQTNEYSRLLTTQQCTPW